MNDKIVFADIKVGYELTPQSKEITQEIITNNAKASLDYNPIHIDPAYAKRINLLGKGTTIAHGMMTLSFMGKIMTDWVLTSGGYIKSLESKFIEPVRPGDTITVRAVVIETHPRPKKEECFVVCDVWCENQHGRKVSVGKAAAYIPN